MVMFLCLVMETMGNWDKELINHGKERGREREREGGGGEMGEGGRDEEKGEKKENRYWKGMVEEERLNYFFMFSRHVFVIVYLVVIQ